MKEIIHCEIHGDMAYGSTLFWKCKREHPLLPQKVMIPQPVKGGEQGCHHT